jgi:DNA repair exonuclease SbcCD nuclease subunit
MEQKHIIENFGDLHFRSESPWYEGNVKFVEWYQNRPKPEPGTTVTTIFEGDVFHRPKENGRVNGLAVRLINVVRARSKGDIIVLQGNHDYSKREESALHVIDALADLNLFIVDAPAVWPNLPCGPTLFLPYIYPKSLVVDKEFSSMHEVYSDKALLQSFTSFPLDDVKVLVGHVGDETAGKYGSDCDLSWFEGKRRLGHIHMRMSKHYTGVPYATNRDEAGKKHYFDVWTPELGWTEEEIPELFEYVEVPYGMKPKFSTNQSIYVNDLIDCPDPEAALEEYRSKYRAEYPEVIFGNASRLADRATRAKESTSEEAETNRQLLEKFTRAKAIREPVAKLMLESLQS